MTRTLAGALCLLFVLAGLSLVPLLGVQNDEALFGYAVFPPRSGVYIPHLGPVEIPLMVMSNVGALKSWLYRPVFAFFGAAAGSPVPGGRAGGCRWLSGSDVARPLTGPPGAIDKSQLVT